MRTFFRSFLPQRLPKAKNLLIVSALLTVLVIAFTPKVDFEQIVREHNFLQLKEVGIESKCTTDAALIAAQPEWVATQCFLWGTHVYDDAMKYPTSALTAYGEFGNAPLFHELRVEYGHQVTRLTAHILENGSEYLAVKDQAREVIGQMIEGAKEGKLVKPTIPDAPTNRQQAILVLLMIQEHDHNTLSKFKFLEDGGVKRRRINSLGEDFWEGLTGGVTNLEEKLLSGEEITAGDYGRATLDIVVIAGGVAAIKKLGAKSVATKGVGKAVVTKGALATGLKATTKVAVKAAPYVAVGVGGYMIVRHPLHTLSITGSTIAVIGNWMGIPSWISIPIGLFILICLLLTFLSPILVPLFAAWRTWRITRWCARGIHRLAFQAT